MKEKKKEIKNKIVATNSILKYANKKDKLESEITDNSFTNKQQINRDKQKKTDYKNLTTLQRRKPLTNKKLSQ